MRKNVLWIRWSNIPPVGGRFPFVKNPIMKPLICVFGAALLAAGMSHAAVLARYAFTGNYTNSEPLPAGIQSANGISFAGGLTEVVSPSGTGISSGAGTENTLFVRSTIVHGTTAAAAVTADDYFSFQITITPGYRLDLTSVGFDHWTSNSYSSNVAVYYTLGGADFSSEAVAVKIGEDTENLGTRSPALLSGNLSGDEALTGQVTFHFLFWDPNNVNTSNMVTRLDDIVVNGVVSQIPEPSLTMIAGASFVFSILLRRRF